MQDLQIRTILILLILSTSFFKTFSQVGGKFSVEIQYGLNGNFFVRDYDELGGPDNKTFLYKKNFLGTISGISIRYLINTKNAIFVGYDRSSNLGTKNFEGPLNGAYVFVRDFNLRHIDNFFQLGYAYLRKIGSIEGALESGVVILTDARQTVKVENFENTIRLEELNYKNVNSIEGGAFLGFGFSRKIDTRFDLGLRSRVYYLISTASLEAITLTPFLSYTF